jgi:hypothetical protein
MDPQFLLKFSGKSGRLTQIRQFIGPKVGLFSWNFIQSTITRELLPNCPYDIWPNYFDLQSASKFISAH